MQPFQLTEGVTMKRAKILNLIIISLILTGCNKDNNLGEYVLTTCPIDVPQELIESGEFSYGFIKVSEFHNKRNGNAIELAVAVFKCKSDSATHEPLVLNTGGPGLSNMDSFIPDLCGDLGNLFLDNRDIVICQRLRNNDFYALFFKECAKSVVCKRCVKCRQVNSNKRSDINAEWRDGSCLSSKLCN